MPITTSDFDELTDELQDIFVESASQSIAGMVGRDVFRVGETNLLNYEHQVLHGVSGIEKVDEGQDLPRLQAEQGDNVTWTQKYYGGMATVTKKMRKFDLFNKIEQQVRTLTQDAFDKVDQSYADALINGFSTSYTDVYGESVTATAPDGNSLFNTSHTTPVSGSTFSNVIQDSSGTNNPSISRDALVNAIRQGKTYTDPNGIIRPIRFDTLLVPPNLEDLALRLTNSDQIPGSANNDTNEMVTGLNVKVWERLETASDGTDGSSQWYLYDSNNVNESLRSLFAERPALDAPDQVYTNKNWDYSLDFFYTLGRGFPAYIWGSQGTN